MAERAVLRGFSHPSPVPPAITLNWLTLRYLQLHLFAHLASLPKPLISASSLLELLHQSFVTALENELGLRAERGDELVRVVLETLLRLNNDGLKSGGEGEEGTLAAIARGVESYMTTRELDWKYLTGEERKAQWVDVSTRQTVCRAYEADAYRLAML